mgnify:CR=1 FL=1
MPDFSFWAIILLLVANALYRRLGPTGLASLGQRLSRVASGYPEGKRRTL